MTESRIHRDLRAGKRALRNRRRALSLPEKVEQVVQLQRIVLPQIRRRRALKPWEKVWDLDPTPHR
jgi:hypothetical protein